MFLNIYRRYNKLSAFNTVSKINLTTKFIYITIFFILLLNTIMTSYRGTGRSWRGRFPELGRTTWTRPGGPGWQGNTRSLSVGMNNSLFKFINKMRL